jgi:hypothetical protein
MANFHTLVASQGSPTGRAARVLALGLATLVFWSCDDVVTGSGHVIEEERLVSGFGGVRLDTEGDILLMQGETEGLAIEAEDNIVAELITEVIADQLVIRTRPDIELEPTRPIIYRITIANVRSLAIDGSGSILADGVETDELELGIDGSGEIALEALRANRIQTTIDGSGDIVLSGVVDREVVEIDGSGNYDALELQARSGHAGIDGSGAVRMYVTDELSVDIDGSGDVLVKGEARLSSSVRGSGEVRRVTE